MIRHRGKSHNSDDADPDPDPAAAGALSYIMTSRKAGFVGRSGGDVLAAAVGVMEGRWRFNHDWFQLPSHLVTSHLRTFCSFPFHPSVLEPHLYL